MQTFIRAASGPGDVRVGLLSLVLLVAGCATPMPGSEEPPVGAPIESLTTLAFDACGDCFEPTVAWDPAGRLFAASANGEGFGVSSDGGRSFTLLAAPSTPDGSMLGDVLLQIDPAGRLWWSDLANTDEAVLPAVHVARSDDGGLTWPLNIILPTALDPLGVTEAADRQWLAFDGDAVYAVCTCPALAAARIIRSDDVGETWGEWTPIASAQGRPGPIGPPVVTNGRLVLPYLFGTVPVSGEDLRAFGVRVAISTDRGATFDSRTVFDARGPDVVCCAFPSIAMDQAGRLAVTWSMAAGAVYVAISEDQGETWSAPIAFGEGARFPHPWIVALPEGRFAVTWFADASDGVEARLAIARPEEAQSALPAAEVLEDAATPNTHFAYLVASPAGDAVAVALSIDGVVVAVRPVT